MRAAVLAIFLVMTGPGTPWAFPPAPGTKNIQFAGVTLFCDTLDQIKAIATAPVDSQDEALAGYETLKDKAGEPDCMIQPVGGVDVVEIVSLGALPVSTDRVMNVWAVHTRNHSGDGWAVWAENIPGKDS